MVYWKYAVGVVEWQLVSLFTGSRIGMNVHGNITAKSPQEINMKISPKAYYSVRLIL